MVQIVKRITRAIQRRILPSHHADAMSSIGSAPFSWDLAAVHLDQNHSHVAKYRYPQYLYGLLCAARTAKAIGCREFTALEFGVAGGNGLLAMEAHARLVEKLWGVTIKIVGFDMATGLPARDEPRDCPFAFGGGAGGEFAMDEEKLRAKLSTATLRLGDISDTIDEFIEEGFAPIGFVSNDFDLYTSTLDSFQLFKLEPERYLPRIHMYFDDIIGYPYTTQNAEFAAIEEYNRTEKNRKIGLYYGLGHCLGAAYRFAPWVDKIFVLELFDHAKFNLPEKAKMPNLALRET